MAEAHSDTTKTATHQALDDGELASRLSAAVGDDAAWDEFHRRYSQKLAAFIRSRVKEPSDAWEDLLQETVIRIQHGAGSFQYRGGSSFLSWTLKIAQRLCLDHHRTRGGRPSSSRLVSYEEVAQELGVLDADDHEPARPEKLRKERMIQQAFDSLSDVDQAVLDLQVLNDYPASHVAGVIGRPEKDVRKIKYRALQKLKRAYLRLDSGKRPRK